MESLAFLLKAVRAEMIKECGCTIENPCPDARAGQHCPSCHGVTTHTDDCPIAPYPAGDCGVCERPFIDHEPDECVMSLRELSELLGWPDPEDVMNVDEFNI